MLLTSAFVFFSLDGSDRVGNKIHAIDPPKMTDIESKIGSYLQNDYAISEAMLVYHTPIMLKLFNTYYRYYPGYIICGPFEDAFNWLTKYTSGYNEFIPRTSHITFGTINS